MATHREPVDPKPFIFRLRGYDQDIAAGTYEADDEEAAFKMALQKCRGFDLPGWSLFCETTGTTTSVAEFFDHSRQDDKGRPVKARA